MKYTGSSVNQASRRYLHSNHQGSIIAITDHAGTILETNTYDSFGVPAFGSPDGVNNIRFSYTEQIYIPELEMYHYKARVYDPVIGRFLQTDNEWASYRENHDFWSDGVYSATINNVGGVYNPRTSCESDFCSSSRHTFESREQISNHMTWANRWTATQTTLFGMSGGAISKSLAAATLFIAGVKGIVSDTDVGIVFQIGDSIIQEVSADFGSQFDANSDSVLKNFSVTFTIVDINNIVLYRAKNLQVGAGL